MDIVKVKYINNRLTPCYIYVFFMVMWSCRTSPFWDLYAANNIMTPVYLCLNAYFYYKYGKGKGLQSFWSFSLCISLWYFSASAKYGTLIKFPYPLLYDFFILYIAYRMMQEHFFYYFEKVVSDLSLVCLVVWIGALLFPVIVPEIMEIVSITPPAKPLASNFFIFGLSSQFEEGIRRNLGFTWEPGRYSCYLLLAIFVNLTINKFQVSHNRNFFILFLSLLSTLSTTGYVVFGVIILYYFYNNNRIPRFIVVLFMIIVLPFVSSLSFMQEKIEAYMFIEHEERQLSYDMDNYMVEKQDMGTVVPQRGTGLTIDIWDFKHDPLIGYGETSRSYSNTMLFHGYVVSTSDGVTKIFASKGIIIGCLFYALLFSSSILFAKKLGVKGNFFLAMLFIGISISYDFWSGVWEYFAFYSLLYYGDLFLVFNSNNDKR